MFVKAIIKKLNWIDWALEILGCAGVVLILYFAFITYPVLPDIIPSNWDYKGIPNGYGSKINFLTVPIIALIVYIGWTIALEYSQTKTLEIATSANVIQYSNFFRLLRFLKIAGIGFQLHHVYTQSMGFLKKEPIIGEINVFIKMAILLFIVGIIAISAHRLRK